MMNTRDLQGMVLGNWRSCSAIGCGCLSVTVVVVLLSVVLLWGVGRSLFSRVIQPPAVVAPVFLDAGNASQANNQATVLQSNNETVTDGNQAAQAEQIQIVATDRQPLPYMPYQNDSPTWANSNGAKFGYLGWANITGSRRTPYNQGQTLTYPNGQVMTVIVADFDYTILQDVQGRRWACPAIVNDVSALAMCQLWQ